MEPRPGHGRRARAKRRVERRRLTPRSSGLRHGPLGTPADRVRLDTRRSGVLLHPTSLPGRFGIGDLGPAAYAFLDYLTQARQSLWQVLPLGPTGFGDSPYSSPSAFAGNPLLVALEPLIDQGLLTEHDLSDLASLPTDHVDFGRLPALRHQALET